MAIELRNVQKAFGEFPAVHGVSFKVSDGELLALLGPSGSGKTTVLRMIAGLEMPDAGDIFIRGQRVNHTPVQRRNIGFVFQNYALFTTMNVFRNIAFGLKVRRWRRGAIETRVEELLELLGLQGLGERYPHQLSGGQRQRVAIARALASKPDLLLLDEPFGAVDARIRQELREWLVRLHSGLRVTTLFVTHDQEEAMEVSKRIAIFSQGRLEQIGAPREVYEQPSNEFVARFIGVLNVLELQVREGVARCEEVCFPGLAAREGDRLRVGFRPHAVTLSSDLRALRYRARIKHAFFLGIIMRLELELPSGLTIRARMSQEEYVQYGLREGQTVSFGIRRYRLLAPDGTLGPEVEAG